MGFLDLFRTTKLITETAKPTPPLYPLVPTYETVTADNKAGVFALNNYWYPDEATCRALMHVFGAAAVTRRTLVEGENVGCPYLLFTRGARLLDSTGNVKFSETQFLSPAGALAFCFINAPEAQFADPVFGTLARRSAWLVIGADHDYVAGMGE
ncbi:MAG TPA: hypothetical protein VN428_02280 [Bryobacteraceae bacterium]|nr:hypothetical protein [Bryobacteraceae bacterium]